MSRPFLTSIACALAAGALAAGVCGVRWHQRVTPPRVFSSQRLLLAPMIGVIEPCIEQPPESAGVAPSLTERCAGPRGSAGALVDATLQALAPHGAGRYELGYTLPVPLLKLFKPAADGGWEIDQALVQRFAATVRDARHPLILYLFSTHFEEHAPIEQALTRDAANMARTQDGPLGVDTYYGNPLYDWSVASTSNTLTARRAQAMRAVLDAMCQLPPEARARIRGVTLLGETHQLFPDFQGGMGFGSPYRITDYSQASARDFRAGLAREWGSIAQLNRVLGSDYASFDEVEPPSRDIRTQPLRRFTEHIDAFAHGSLPVTGWAYVRNPLPGYVPRVHVYLDGRRLGAAPVTLNRQDVLAARPEFGDANTGWRLDLDFRRLPPGVHQLDLFLQDRPGHLIAMGARRVSIMDRKQSAPQPVAQARLPRAERDVPAGVEFHADFPRDGSDYYYNPLARLWDDFRARQVTRYLAFFDAQARQSCLADVPRYTHQIIPNPNWDATRFAIDDSLRPHDGMRLGVSLYGEAAYGASLTPWLRRAGRLHYGITEFHPLKAMTAGELMDVFDAHARRGAQFLSFFLEPEWEGGRVPREHNPFAFDPLNSQFGSDALYRAVRQGLAARQLR